MVINKQNATSQPSPIARVELTPEASALLSELRGRYANKEQNKLLFHYSASPNEGSSPLCLLASETRVADSDLYLGSPDGCDFFIKPEPYAYWSNSHLTIDVIASSEREGFSLESRHGFRFVIYTRALNYKEYEQMKHSRPPNVAELSARRAEIRKLRSANEEAGERSAAKPKAKMRLFAR